MVVTRKRELQNLNFVSYLTAFKYYIKLTIKKQKQTKKQQITEIQPVILTKKALDNKDNLSFS